MADPGSPTPFTVRVTPGPDLIVVELFGEADLTALDAIDAAFDEATTHPGPVVVDLAGLAFMDSSALRALIQAHSRVSASGRRFGLACPVGGTVGQVLETTQMHRIMPVHPDRETAARALRA